MSSLPPASTAAVVVATWTGNGASTLWSEAANWDIGMVPDNGADTYQVSIGGPAFVILDSSRTVDTLDLGTGATLNVEGVTLTISGGSLLNDGVVELGGPGGGGQIRYTSDLLLSGVGHYLIGASTNSIEETGSAFPTLTIDGLAIEGRTGDESITVEGSPVVNLSALTFENLFDAKLVTEPGTSISNDCIIQATDVKFFDISSRLQAMDTAPCSGTRPQLSLLGTTLGKEVARIDGHTIFVAQTSELFFNGGDVIAGCSLEGPITVSPGLDGAVRIEDLVTDAGGQFAIEFEGIDPAVEIVPEIGDINLERIIVQSDTRAEIRAGRLGLGNDLVVEPASASPDPATSLTFAGPIGSSTTLELNGRTINVGDLTFRVAGRTEMEGGRVTVTDTGTFRVRDVNAQAGGAVDLIDGSRLLFIGGVVDSVDFSGLSGENNNLLGVNDATLRDLEIPAGMILQGVARLDGDIILNGRALLGSISFDSDDFNTLSGSGEIVFPDVGSGEISGGKVTLASGNGLRITGGSGSISTHIVNLGSLALNHSGTIDWLGFNGMTNQGSIEAVSGIVNLIMSVDNAGGVLRASGGRLEIGDPGVSGSFDAIQGGTIQGLSAQQKAVQPKGPTEPGVFIHATRLTDVTLKNDITALSGFEMTSSLVNEGRLILPPVDELTTISTSQSDTDPPFLLGGGGEIDFGDRSAFTNQRARIIVKKLVNVDNTIRGNVLITSNVFPFVEFTNQGTVVVDNAAGTDLHGPTVNQGTIEVSNGAILDTTGEFRNEGQFTAAAGTSLDMSPFIQAAGSAALAGDLNGSLHFEGGSADVASGTPIGNLQVLGGVFDVGGAGIGSTEVRATFSMADGGSLAFTLGGADASERDLLRTNITGLGNSSFAGDVIIRTANNFVPQPGDSYRLISFFGSRNDSQFARVVNQTPFPALDFSLSYTGNSMASVMLDVAGDPSIVVESDLEVGVAVCHRNTAPGLTEGALVSLTNHGPEAASDAVLTIPTPTQAELAPTLVLPAGCAEGTASITCSYPLLNPGESRLVPLGYVVKAGASGTVSIGGSATATEADSSLGNNEASADLTIVSSLIEEEGFESCE